jgi:putative integral membrane protein (TIGR02587 family)
MTRNGSSQRATTLTDRDFFIGLARAAGGAIFFSLPMMMTMEMWWLGFYMPRARLALFMLLMVPLLIALDRYSGFRQTSTWLEDSVDGLVAYGVGFVTSAVVLFLFNIVHPGQSVREVVGMISVQAVPASFGAVLAASQLGGRSGEQEREKEDAGYGGELLFMAAGALFLAFNLAPTEEMILIAFRMTPWHAIALIGTTLGVMHATVYAVGFEGQEEIPPGMSHGVALLRFTVVGYAIALLMSALTLWLFGRYGSSAYSVHLKQAVVLGFPAGVGAAAARLIL